MGVVSDSQLTSISQVPPKCGMNLRTILPTARRRRYRSRSDKFHSRWNARRPLVPTAVRARARADLSGSAPLNEGKRPRWRRKQFPRPGEAYHKGPSPSHRGPRLDSTVEELYMTPRRAVLAGLGNAQISPFSVCQGATG